MGIKFSSFNKINEEVTKVETNVGDILVKKEIPMKDVLELIDIIVETSYEKNLYNPSKVSIGLVVGIFLSYTDIEFTEEERADWANIYQIVVSNDLINVVFSAISQNQRTFIYEGVDGLLEARQKTDGNFASVVRYIMDKAPQQAEAISKIIDSWDQSKFEYIKEIANQNGLNSNIIPIEK